MCVLYHKSQFFWVKSIFKIRVSHQPSWQGLLFKYDRGWAQNLLRIGSERYIFLSFMLNMINISNMLLILVVLSISIFSLTFHLFNVKL